MNKISWAVGMMLGKIGKDDLKNHVKEIVEQLYAELYYVEH